MLLCRVRAGGSVWWWVCGRVFLACAQPISSGKHPYCCYWYAPSSSQISGTDDLISDIYDATTGTVLATNTVCDTLCVLSFGLIEWCRLWAVIWTQTTNGVWWECQQATSTQMTTFRWGCCGWPQPTWTCHSYALFLHNCTLNCECFLMWLKYQNLIIILSQSHVCSVMVPWLRSWFFRFAETRHFPVTFYAKIINFLVLQTCINGVISVASQ